MDGFAKVGLVADVPPGERLVIDFEYDSVVVVNAGGTFYAVADLCTHDDGPLADGDLDDAACALVCPRHGARFDLRSGKGTFPAVAPIPTYAVKIVDGAIYVESPDD